MIMTLTVQFPLNMANIESTKCVQIKKILSLMILLNISTFIYKSSQD